MHLPMIFPFRTSKTANEQDRDTMALNNRKLGPRSATSSSEPGGAGCGPVLDLALLVERQDSGVVHQIAVEANNIVQLSGELGALASLNRRTRCDRGPCASQMHWTELTLILATSVMAAPVQCATFGDGPASTSATTRWGTSRLCDGMHGGCVLS